MEEPNVVGAYETKRGRYTHRYVFLEDGAVEFYRNDNKISKSKWKIIDDKLQVEQKDGSVEVARINSEGSLSYIAYIVKWGKRYDLSEIEQSPFKKIQ